MVVVLSVAEKPSVARELANIIGRGAAQKRNGRSPYNHVFDIHNCEFNGGQADMKMTSVLGHMMELEFRGEYRSWRGCSPEDLFTAPLTKTVKKDMEKVAQTLAEEARKCSVLLLWLDCDLEGENIAFEVVQVCTAANPRLTVLRARFSALIARDVLATLRAPQRPNQHMSEAVDARQEIDLRLGAAFTRFQTLCLQSRFPQLSSVVVSYGPCQFPTLGFVVERYLKIQNFIPEDYWSISCEVEGSDPDEASGKLSTSFRWKRGNLYDRLSCVLLYQLCVEAGQARVIECSARATSKYKPCPLNTIELQKRASRFLRISSDDTMAAAEALYQRGILSYPRTETDFFKEGFELTPLIQEHGNHPDWGQFSRRLLDENGFEHPKSGGHDDQAHPPIHPTQSVALADFDDPKERAIYELVTRHFLACCAKDARGDQTTVRIQFSPATWPFSQLVSRDMPNGGVIRPPQSIRSAKDIGAALENCGFGGEVFEATGLMIRERNWLDVYRWEKWYANKVPSVHVGDVILPKRLEMTEGRTAPPPPISESDLISAMDSNGIGTDATIATHIKTIQERKYAFKDNDSRFVPTELGIALVEGYNNMGYQLNKPFLRAAMEKDCQRVARGELSKAEMIENCLSQMKECFKGCRRDVMKLEEAVVKYMGGVVGQVDHSQMNIISRAFSRCGQCGRGMDLKGSDAGRGDARAQRLLSCSPCGRSYLLPAKGEITPHDHTCPICNFQVVTMRNAETGKSHTLCPMCYKNPPGPPASSEGVSELRCYACAHACPLAGTVQGGNAAVAPCAEVGCRDGQMKLKKNERGYMLGCSSYPNCRATWWLPKFIRAATVDVTGGPCQRCKAKTGYDVLKLNLSVVMSVAPPGTPPELVACPVCNRVWSESYCDALKLPVSGGMVPHNIAHRNGNDGPAGQHREPASLARQGGGGAQWHSNAADREPRGGLNPTHPVQQPVHRSDTSDYGAAAVGGDSYRSSRGGRGGRGAGRGNGAHTRATAGDNDGSAPTCLCGDKSATRTVSKEGPNKGRLFYVCAKPKGEGCNLFAWADGSSSGFGSSNRGAQNFGPQGGRGAAPVQSGGGRGGGNMICSKCKEPGHYARQCPAG